MPVPSPGRTTPPPEQLALRPGPARPALHLPATPRALARSTPSSASVWAEPSCFTIRCRPATYSAICTAVAPEAVRIRLMNATHGPTPLVRENALRQHHPRSDARPPKPTPDMNKLRSEVGCTSVRTRLHHPFTRQRSARWCKLRHTKRRRPRGRQLVGDLGEAARYFTPPSSRCADRATCV